MEKGKKKLGWEKEEKKMKLCSERMFYLLTPIVLIVWIILDLIPSSQCINTYFLGFLHWDICSNMGFLVNLIYVLFQISIVLISAYLIVVGIMFFNSKK